MLVRKEKVAMNKELMPEIIVLIWSEEDGNICVQLGTEKIVLNKTASIVWKYIDGFKSVGEIIQEIFEEYKETDSHETVSNVVIESLKMFEKERLINLKEEVDFEGWLKYE